MPIVWTDEQAERLTVLWQHEDRPACKEIADTLNEEFKMDISRSAVIGKVHRLKLEKRGNNGNYKGNGLDKRPKRVSAPRRQSAQPKFVTQPEVILRCVGIEPLHVGLIDLEPHHCRYPYGEGPFTFCGHAKADASSYCDAHADLCAGLGTVSERMAAPIKGNRATSRFATLWGTYEVAL